MFIIFNKLQKGSHKNYKLFTSKLPSIQQKAPMTKLTYKDCLGKGKYQTILN